MKNTLRTLRIAVPLFVAFLFGCFLAQASGVPEYAVSVGIATVGASFLLKMEPGMLAETIPSTNNPDISALANYAGKYARQLFAVMRNGLDIANDVTVRPGIKHKENLTKLDIAHGIEAYKEDFNLNAGDVKYTPRTIEVELLKRDLRINPLKYRTTWMAEVMKPGVNVTDIPYAQFFWRELLASIAEEVNNDAYYAVKGDGLSFSTSVTGFAKIIADGITADEITPVATGAITNNNAVAAVEAVANDMPVTLQKKGFDIDFSYNLWQKYQFDYRERYGKYVQRNKDGFFTVDAFGPKVKLNPVTWMGNSQRILAAPKEELIMGVDALGDMDKIEIDRRFELMDVRILFALGFQIRELKNIRVNDQEELVPTP
ncbi:MAG: hypothetical protein QHC79_09605 [Pseudosphingobacterium sp.]|nr:hypothetical protein [Pseudosphingobacterium sp.]